MDRKTVRIDGWDGVFVTDKTGRRCLTLARNGMKGTICLYAVGDTDDDGLTRVGLRYLRAADARALIDQKNGA